MVALVTSTEANFEAASGEHEQGAKDHAPISLGHESSGAEDEEGSAFDSGSGASGSGRETEIKRSTVNIEY